MTAEDNWAAAIHLHDDKAFAFRNWRSTKPTQPRNVSSQFFWVVLTELGLKGTISGALPFVLIQDISSSETIERR